MKVLTADIGNTNILFCFFKKNKIISSIKINISKLCHDQLLLSFKKYKDQLNSLKVIISSVVPSKNKILEEFFLKYSMNIFYLNKIHKTFNLKTYIKNKKTIGDDRIVNILYAKELYKKSIVVVDFGTATTFDVLNHLGFYSGGVITPGINLSLESLKSKTEKLPLVSFRKVDNVIGTSTKHAIQSGFFWGYVSMVEGLINKINKEERRTFKIILTGGNSIFFKNIFKNVLTIDPFFTSKGLNFILTEFLKNEKKI